MSNLADEYAQRDAPASGLSNILNNGSGNYAERLSVQEGPNVFRALPVHRSEPAHSPWMTPFGHVWLPRMVEEKVDGVVQMQNGKPKMKKVNKPVFNSKDHAKGVLNFDIVDLYIAYNEAKYKAQYPGKDNPDYLQKMLPIHGEFKPGGGGYQGIKKKTNYMAYVLEINPNTRQMGKDIKLLQVTTKLVVDGLNRSQTQELTGEMIKTDIYSNVKDGLAFQIDYDKKATTAAAKYTVSLYKKSDPTDKSRLMVYPISTEILGEFEKLKTLNSQFGPNVFKKTDFYIQLDGLKMFDAEHNYDLFEDPHWVEIVEQRTEEVEIAFADSTSEMERENEAVVDEDALPFGNVVSNSKVNNPVDQSAVDNLFNDKAAGTKKPKW